ncbi:hypothetical protein C8F01DRAFT_1245395 [Mycena amicta]|nr:hypothetical protein C8F01DRAFT_1245395 [Mycena amicta]
MDGRSSFVMVFVKSLWLWSASGSSPATRPEDYELLPTTDSNSSEEQVETSARKQGSGTGHRRWRGVVLVALPWAVVLLLLVFSSPFGGSTQPIPLPIDPPQPSSTLAPTDCPPPPPPPPRTPPLYEGYHAYERTLPQHDLSAAYPDGRDTKFLWIANHGFYFGWGNYMQEMVLNAYLAYASQRAYVFDNYTWEREGPDVTSWNGHLIPARIPLSAIISGPIIGGRMPPAANDVPRAVSREWYQQVCAESERVVLDTRTIQDSFPGPPTATQIIDRWVDELPALFGYELTNTERALDVFPSLSASPILSNFGWSSLILGEFLANSHHFGVDNGHDIIAPSNSESPISGLLVLHVRRGDYESWCAEAVGNGLTYTGFNRFSQLPDKAPAAGKKASVGHCLPSISDIVDKVRRVVEAPKAPQLTRVYVMTNAKPPWLSELVSALHQVHPWSSGISTSRDLSLSWEGTFVAQAVDMLVGQRAEVLIGNGYSSLTSNIVMLRMHNPLPHPQNTHFW